MNKDKAQQVLAAFGRPGVKVGDKSFVFARQTQQDIESLEKMNDEELINHWKSLSHLNLVIGQVSLNDMQRIQLIELEMEERKGIDIDALQKWLENEIKNFDPEKFFKQE